MSRNYFIARSEYWLISISIHVNLDGSILHSATFFSCFTLGVPFPKNFQQVCKKILSRLFRVFVHVYIHHFDSICSMGAEAHINTCYKHYYYFISEFNLIENSELEPLVRIKHGLRFLREQELEDQVHALNCWHHYSHNWQWQNMPVYCPLLQRKLHLVS